MHETIPPETSGKRKKERKNRSRYPRAVSLILSTLLRIAAVDSGYLIFERAYSEREGGEGGREGSQKPPGIPGIRGVRVFGCVEPYNEPPQNKGCSSTLSLSLRPSRAQLARTLAVFVSRSSLWYGIQSMALFTGHEYIRMYNLMPYPRPTPGNRGVPARLKHQYTYRMLP